MSTKQEIFTLMGGRVKIHRGHYNPTSDAVWLAAFAPHNAKTALDVGIGTGGVSLCYLANNPDTKITGIDTSDDMLTACKHNAHHNADLCSWVSRCIARVRPMGTFCIITDATTIAQVIAEMSKKLGDITIFPLFGAKSTAERVLISGKLGTKGISVLHNGLPMNYEPILRDGLTIADNLSTLTKKC